MVDDILYSAKHYAAKAKEASERATLAVAQVGNGIVPVICCKDIAPQAETLYKVRITNFQYIQAGERQYGYVRVAGSSGANVPTGTYIYWDKRGVYHYDTVVADGNQWQYTGDTQVNTIAQDDMYYNTTDNKIHTSDGTDWDAGFSLTPTILVLDLNTNKLMHLFDGTLEGVYRL